MSHEIQNSATRPKRPPLRKHAVSSNPFDLFTNWFSEALASDVIEPQAMTLATATPEGRPSARVVLLRGYDVKGFCFYTNYMSRKGQELAANPYAAAVFWWGKLERQIRIEGEIQKLTPQESDDYFNSRPLGSRFGAMLSPQSQVIPTRAVLEEQLRALEAQYGQTDPPRPPHWGGYRLMPHVIEFWQSGRHRLHDRLRYTQQADGSWVIERLSP